MRLDEAYRQLNIVQDFIPRGNSNRPGTPLSPSSVTIHNTDNRAPGANAAAHARYQKGPDAQKRQVSWHFTVDDGAVYQSLPTNEVGWHTATKAGNHSSIGIEICMNDGLDVSEAYARAALLVAVVARKERIPVPTSVFQHHDWSGKDCPIVLRSAPGGWKDFLAKVEEASKALSDPPSEALALADDDDHHGPSGRDPEAVASATAAPKPALAAASAPVGMAWGKSVDAGFRSKVSSLAARLGCDPSHLMASMAFETGSTFSPSIQNPHSHATGLIQFMPSTARSLGTSVAALAAMSAVEQLDWVYRYLERFTGRMRSLSDVYMTILYPVAVGRPEATVLFASGTIAYEQNRGLDVNHDGTVTKGEATSKVQAMLDLGLSSAHRG